MRDRLHPASNDEASGVWPVVRKAHLFDSVERYEEFRAGAPWRVQVSGHGEAAILEPWRDHLDVVAIKGMWCAADRIPGFIDELADVAAGQGFGRLLSPLVSTDVASFYEAGGMEPLVHIVVLVLDRSDGAVKGVLPQTDVRLRSAVPADLEEILCLDALCFDEFWRYDAGKMAIHFAENRVMVAEKDGAVIGYTLATIIRESATLGRIAVHPDSRRQGVGGALLADALGYFARAGMETVTLCTQEENAVSRRLYSAAGMRELPAKLEFLVRDLKGV